PPREIPSNKPQRGDDKTKASGEGKELIDLITPATPVVPAAPSKLPPQEPAPKPGAPPAEAPAGRKLIRTGEVEFEVDSFDSALATVTKLVNGIKGAFVGTVNSDKLANGKVKGSVVVRVPPESLDSLVLDLRKELGKSGELKGQRIGAQDITKQY